MASKVMYRGQADDKGFELFKFGSADAFGRRCGVLIRFGTPIKRFIASKAQVKAAMRGGRINITEAMITASHGRASCAGVPAPARWSSAHGRLMGTRRRRRR